MRIHRHVSIRFLATALLLAFPLIGCVSHYYGTGVRGKVPKSLLILWPDRRLRIRKINGKVVRWDAYDTVRLLPGRYDVELSFFSEFRGPGGSMQFGSKSNLTLKIDGKAGERIFICVAGGLLEWQPYLRKAPKGCADRHYKSP